MFLRIFENGNKDKDGNEGKEKNNYNAFTLFLILILLILSEEALVELQRILK